MRKPRRLELAQVSQQRTGSGDRSIILLADAEPLEREQLEVASQLLARQRRIELPGFALRDQRAFGSGACRSRGEIYCTSRPDDLSRRQARQQWSHIIRPCRIETELAGGKIGRGDAEGCLGHGSPASRCAPARTRDREVMYRAEEV